MDAILKQLLNACHPLLPAEPDQYVDLTNVRGGDVFIQQICQDFDESTESITALFTGHLGSGKSSELEHLAHELLRHGPNCYHKRYFPIVINVLDYLDVFDSSLLEILHAIVAEISAELHEKEGIGLKAGYFEKRWEEIRSLLFSDVEVKKIDIPLWKGKVEIGLKQADRKTRTEVRNHLEPQMPSLISEINTLLIDVRNRLAMHNPQDGGPKYDNIVLIVDNMERIRQVAGKSQGDESERALFVDGATQLNALRANIIYTIPLGLVRSIEPQLEALYGRKPFILPNVKTFTRENHLRFQPGRDKPLKCFSSGLRGRIFVR